MALNWSGGVSPRESGPPLRVLSKKARGGAAERAVGKLLSRPLPLLVHQTMWHVWVNLSRVLWEKSRSATMFGGLIAVTSVHRETYHRRIATGRSRQQVQRNWT